MCDLKLQLCGNSKICGANLPFVVRRCSVDSKLLDCSRVDHIQISAGIIFVVGGSLCLLCQRKAQGLFSFWGY